MLNKTFYRFTLAAAFSLVSLSANANIYIDPNWPVDTSGVELGVSGESYWLAIRHQPYESYGFDTTGVKINYQPNQITDEFGEIPIASLMFTQMTLDVGADLYIVKQRDNFSSNTISAGKFLKLNSSYLENPSYFMPDFRTSYQGDYWSDYWNDFLSNGTFYEHPMFSTNGTFFLGINSGQNNYQEAFNGVNTQRRSIYGWAQFQYDASGIRLISSALTYNQGGIIVGTLNTVPVPEAETSAMLLMGAGVMGFMARRRKQVAA